MNVKQKLLIAGASMVPILGIGSVALATASSAASGAGTQVVATQDSGSTTQDGVEPAVTTPETTTSADFDGTGGHEDLYGGNADHQAQGQE